MWPACFGPCHGKSKKHERWSAEALAVVQWCIVTRHFIARVTSVADLDLANVKKNILGSILTTSRFDESNVTRPSQPASNVQVQVGSVMAM